MKRSVKKIAMVGQAENGKQKCGFVDHWLCAISKIQLVVYYQCCILIGWATTVTVTVIAH